MNTSVHVLDKWTLTSNALLEGSINRSMVAFTSGIYILFFIRTCPLMVLQHILFNNGYSIFRKKSGFKWYVYWKMLSYQDEEHDIELRRKLCNERTTYISSLFGLKVKIYSNDLQIHYVILTTKSINVRHDGVCICGAIFRLVC